MPLSEEELKMLEQMERALSEEDPKFVSTIRGTTPQRVARRRAALALAGLLVGVGVLMAGAIRDQTVVGVIGFVVMLGCAAAALNALRGGFTGVESVVQHADGHWPRRHHGDDES